MLVKKKKKPTITLYLYFSNAKKIRQNNKIDMYITKTKPVFTDQCFSIALEYNIVDTFTGKVPCTFFNKYNHKTIEAKLYDKASKHFEDFDIESYYDKNDFFENECVATIYNKDIN